MSSFHVSSKDTEAELNVDYTKIVDAKGEPLTANYLKSQNVLPLLVNSYNLHNLQEEDKLIPPLSFDKLLDAPISTVSTLNLQPGDPWFIFWFVVSTFLPLLSSCLGPLANMVSIIGLAESWRTQSVPGELVPDPGGIRALNSISLAFGLVGNVSLLANFSTTRIYIIAQSVSIVCWTIASATLAAALILLNVYHMQGDHFSRSEGHWLSVFASGMYAMCTLTMSFNVLGFVLGKYPPILNLNQKERALMRYTVSLAIWLVIGACVCAKLLPDINYGPALYYCVVSVLTVGLGDILPEDSAAKAFILVFSLVGVIMMGLVVAMIRQVSHNTNQPVVLWHRMETKRRKCLHMIKKHNFKIRAADSFTIMRHIEHKSAIEQQSVGLLLTLLIFCVFWLIGALVFHYVEGWSYFNAVYFCLLCLITIGYGDFAPKKPLGRVFFITWAISAVPMMTILISNVGDTLFGSTNIAEVLKNISNTLGEVLSVSNKLVHPSMIGNPEIETIESLNRELGDEILQQQNLDVVVDEDSQEAHLNDDDTENPFDSTTASDNVVQRVRRKIETQKSELIGILDFVNQLKPLLEDTIDTPAIEYPHDQWTSLMTLLHSDTYPGHSLSRSYWLSDESPLRLPLQEPNYFISRIFFKIETDLMKLIEESNLELETIYKSQAQS